MKTTNQRIGSILVKLACIGAILCSTAYLLMLGWYNTFLLDDYGFIAETDRSGVPGMVHDMYYYQQSRFSTFFVLGWILKIWGHASNLIGYTILLLILGYSVLYYALRNITDIRNKWLLAGCSILITNIAIMAYLELSTFYWVCCALYTLSTYAAIALITAIFYDRGKSWVRWTIVVLCSLYLCGGAENFTPLVIAVMGIALLYQMVKNHMWEFWRTVEQKMMIVSVLILFAGFVVVLLGPGTSNRATEGEGGYLAHFTIVSFVTKLIGASAIFAMRLLSKGLYYLLLIPFGLWIGRAMPESKEKIWKRIIISCVIVFGLIELSIAAPVVGMGWYAPLRSYSFVSFMMAALIIHCGALIGQKYRSDCAIWLSAISAIIIISMSLYYMRTEYPMVKKTHAQIVQRNNAIQEHVVSGSKEPIVLDSIYYPVKPNAYAILRSAINKCLGQQSSHVALPSVYYPYEFYDITKDPSHWKNQALKKYFKAEFDIVG